MVPGSFDDGLFCKSQQDCGMYSSAIYNMVKFCDIFECSGSAVESVIISALEITTIFSAYNLV